MREPEDGSRAPFAPTRRPYSWGAKLIGNRGARRNDMHPEELMKPDLLSEIVLLTFGTLLFSSLVWFVVAALARP